MPPKPLAPSISQVEHSDAVVHTAALEQEVSGFELNETFLCRVFTASRAAQLLKVHRTKY